MRRQVAWGDTGGPGLDPAGSWEEMPLQGLSPGGHSVMMFRLLKYHSAVGWTMGWSWVEAETSQTAAGSDSDRNGAGGRGKNWVDLRGLGK